MFVNFIAIYINRNLRVSRLQVASLPADVTFNFQMFGGKMKNTIEARAVQKIAIAEPMQKPTAKIWKTLACVTIVFATSSFLSACAQNFSIAKNPSANGSIRIATWNVQTFFDAVNDGIEYSEFQKSSNWTQKAYEARLEKLCDGLKKLDAEIYVLEEIENERIIYDITNRLAGEVWHKDKKLNYALFAKDEGSSIGCAVLSRLPLICATVHSLDIRTEKDKQPAMRPLLKVTVTKNDRELTLFVNHWKSKSGGEEKTEVWRDWQESLLVKNILQIGDCTAISCGDFNRDIYDFATADANSESDDEFASAALAEVSASEQISPSGSSSPSPRPANVLLRTAFFGTAQTVAAYSPWLDDTAALECGSEGSYYFQESWERIDHFFATGNSTISDFIVATDSPFTQADGTPDRYTLFNGRGCSDHLPLVCTVSY